MSTLIILTPGFPADENDTTCLPAVQQFVLSVKMQAFFTRIVVLSFQYPFESKNYVWNGVEIISIGGRNKPRLRRLVTWFRVYKALKFLRKTDDLKGLLSLWLGESALVGDFFAKRYKLKHYMWLHGQDAKASNKYIKRINPLGSRVIAISEFIKDEFNRNHAILPFMVAENGVMPNSFPSLNEGNRPYDIIGVGSLIPLKNYALFIEIIFELKKKYPEIKAGIAGTGEGFYQLKKQVKALNLETNIEFFGLISHTNVLVLMNSSRIFLHTSDYEGNSSVLAEALYSGCKVVSTCTLNNKTVQNLYIEKNKKNLTDTVLKLLSEETQAERILFNNMEDTAKKIANLFLN